MPNYNKVILIGHLTRDPQLRYTANQTAVADLGIAINHKFKDKEEVCFLDVTAWAKTGEFVNKWFKKGNPILIEGRLKFDTWEDKNGGGKRSKVSVVAESVSFVGGGKQDQDDNQAPVETGISKEKQFDEGDIPF